MKNVYAEYFEILLIFQIFGLAPIGRTLCQRVLELCTFCLSLGCSLAIFLTTLFYTGIVRQNSLSAFMTVFVFITQVVVILTILFKAYTARQKQLNFMETIYNIDQYFRRNLSKVVIYNDLRKKYCLKIFSLIAVCFFTLIPVAFFMSSRQIPFVWLYVAQRLHGVIVIRLVFLQIIFYIALLQDRLQMLFDVLQNLSKCKNNKLQEAPAISIMFKGNRQHNYNRQDYNDILHLKKVYGYIYDASELLNYCFGWPLLGMFTQYFINCTSYSYFIFMAIEQQVPKNQLFESLIGVFGINILAIALCYSCYSCGKTVNI